jgi:hypothetical protein
MTIPESIDIGKFHAQAIVDLAQEMLCQITAGKAEKVLETLVLLRRREDGMAMIASRLMAKPVLREWPDPKRRTVRKAGKD